MTGSIDAYDIIKYNGMMSYKDKSRMFFFDKLIESHHSSWKCAKDTYERKGRLTLSGLTQIVRDNVSSKSLEKLAEENYKGDQEKALHYLVKKLGPQLNRRFLQIYDHKFDGNNSSITVDRDEFTSLDRTFKSSSKSSRSKILKVSAEISEILEKFSDVDKKEILKLL